MALSTYWLVASRVDTLHDGRRNLDLSGVSGYFASTNDVGRPGCGPIGG
ncbi:MAG: hypothetical protein WAL71_10710 [Terriglobales bacterium]